MIDKQIKISKNHGYIDENYRIALLSTLYLTVSGINISSLISTSHPNMPKFLNQKS